MAHKTTRPTPLKDLQIPVQADQSRRYLLLDAYSESLPSPAYPFEDNARAPPCSGSPTCTSCVVPQSPSLVQVEPRVDTLHCCWDDYRSFTPPISPPALFPRGQDTDYPSKRSGRTFALVPAQVDGKHVFTHVVADNDSPSSSEDGLPEDMLDILRQLDDLASWIKGTLSSRNVTSIVRAQSTGSLCDGLFHDKGKDRLLSSPPSEYDICQYPVDTSSGAVSGNPTKISSATDRQSEGFIYVPDCNTPEFLVGSSSSPIAYPVCGYSSHSSRHSPHLPETTHDIPYHRRFLERRSAPCPSTSSLISPSSGKTSFKSLFQRSRCNTTAVVRPSIPSGHVPVENPLRQGKRMRLPWLRV